ncbi:ACP S-malonyltransferase [Candidatus Pelagibacter sp.]|nr:ACP S-malonyltransferase [Candidatus Pelagibacter sp.]
MISVVFPGQGSQKVGMGSEFYNKYDYIKQIYKSADEIIGYKISDLIFEGPQEKLNQTTFTQPAIYLIGYTICEILKKETDFFNNKINFFAGHSLGEYTALTAADSLTFEQGLNLLKSRGEAMQTAVPLGEGGMLAVLGVETDVVQKILNNNFEKIKCYLANDNSKGQLILSGKNDALNKFATLLKEKKIKNIKLPVSAPFHCELMKEATIKMEKLINEQKFNNPNYKVVSNVTATEYQNTEEIKDLLIKQIESPVRWRESIDYMINNGTSTFVEIGPGKVLSGLIKRINKDVKVLNIDTLEDIQGINL